MAIDVKALLPEGGTIMRHSQRAWASVSFSGERHEVQVQYPNTVELDMGEIESKEYTVPGHLVADVAVTALSIDMVLGHTDITIQFLFLKED